MTLSRIAAVAADDGRGVNLVAHQVVGASQELAGEDHHRRRAVADLAVLQFRQLNQDLRVFSEKCVEETCAAVSSRVARDRREARRREARRRDARRREARRRETHVFGATAKVVRGRRRRAVRSSREDSGNREEKNRRRARFPNVRETLFRSRSRTFAAGCSTSRSLRIVAPSLVIVTSPMSSTSILSRPTGPSEVFTMFATAWTAMTVGKRARERGGERSARVAGLTGLGRGRKRPGGRRTGARETSYVFDRKDAPLAAAHRPDPSVVAICRPDRSRFSGTDERDEVRRCLGTHRWTCGHPVRSASRPPSGLATPCSSCRLTVYGPGKVVRVVRGSAGLRSRADV